MKNPLKKIVALLPLTFGLALQAQIYELKADRASEQTNKDENGKPIWYDTTLNVTLNVEDKSFTVYDRAERMMVGSVIYDTLVLKLDSPEKRVYYGEPDKGRETADFIFYKKPKLSGEMLSKRDGVVFIHLTGPLRVLQEASN